MVVPLSMVLHELSTNAAKYGAFSVEHGRVNIAWLTDGGKVRFTWVETDGPPVEGEIKAGFGSKLIKSALGASPRISYSEQGLEFEITVPLEDVRGD